MAESFPPDEFDNPDLATHRVGAHRRRPLPGRRWIIFGSCVAVAAIIAGVGFLLLNLVAQGNQFIDDGIGTGGSASAEARQSSTVAAVSGSLSASASSSSSSAAPQSSTPVTPSSSAAVDKTTAVTVLNATSTTGLAASARTTLSAAGWTVVTTGNANIRASQSSVIYASSADRAAARAVAKKLGIDTVTRQSDASTAIVVTLGADFAG